MRFMNSNYQDPRNFSQAPQQTQSPTLQQAIEMLRGGNTFGATNILQSLVGLPQRDYSFQQSAMGFQPPTQNLGIGQPQAPMYGPPAPQKMTNPYAQQSQGLFGAARDTGRPANPYATAKPAASFPQTPRMPSYKTGYSEY